MSDAVRRKYFVKQKVGRSSIVSPAISMIAVQQISKQMTVASELVSTSLLLSSPSWLSDGSTAANSHLVRLVCDTLSKFAFLACYRPCESVPSNSLIGSLDPLASILNSLDAMEVNRMQSHEICLEVSVEFKPEKIIGERSINLVCRRAAMEWNTIALVLHREADNPTRGSDLNPRNAFVARRASWPSPERINLLDCTFILQERWVLEVQQASR